MDKNKTQQTPKGTIPKKVKVSKIENSKSNRNFLNWLVYHLSNGVSFDEAIKKTVKTFQNDEEKGKSFATCKSQIVRATETLTASCHNNILK